MPGPCSRHYRTYATTFSFIPEHSRATDFYVRTHGGPGGQIATFCKDLPLRLGALSGLLGERRCIKGCFTHTEQRGNRVVSSSAAVKMDVGTGRCR
jgi:hypothetical protein